ASGNRSAQHGAPCQRATAARATRQFLESPPSSGRFSAIRKPPAQCHAHALEFLIQFLEVRFATDCKVLRRDMAPSQAHFVDAACADVGGGAAQSVQLLAERREVACGCRFGKKIENLA